MSDKSPPPAEPPKKLKRVSRTAVFWLLMALAAMLAFQFMGRGDRSVGRISPSELYRQLENDNILEVTFFGESEVRGEFKNTVEVSETNVNEFVTNIVPGAAPDLADQLRAQQVEVDARPPPPGWLPTVMAFLPWLLIIVFWIWIVRSMQAGGNRAFQFGRSRAKLISPDTPQVTFADVAGAEEAKVELEEIIEFLKDPPRFSRLGGRLPKGVLLVGPPGTGKTLLARAVAGEAARPFFQMSGSDFVEMFVGVGASRVRDLFEQGKAHAPCLIFVDEIDAVGRHRGAGLGGGHDEREQTLNALLVEMDGFEANEGVILLAARRTVPTCWTRRSCAPGASTARSWWICRT